MVAVVACWFFFPKNTSDTAPVIPPHASSSVAASATFTILNVPILIYHSIAPYTSSTTPLVRGYTIPPSMLDKQLGYLKINGYAVISFESLIDAMRNASSIVPPKSVVLTFDDGWEDQYREAFPILEKYGDVATFFVFTNGPDSGDPNFLSWSQLKEMQNAGMDIESHSVSHPYLFTITNQADLWKEIEGSREIIESHMGRAPDIFAYPFGEYNALDIALLKSAGYRAARADLGWLPKTKTTGTTTDALYKLNGIQVTDDFSRFLNIISQ